MINEVKKTFKRFGEKWISIKKSYVYRKESSQRKRFNKEIRNIKKNMVDMFCNYHIGSNRKFFQWSRQNINYALYLVDQCCVCNRSDGNPNFRKCIYSKNGVKIQARIIAVTPDERKRILYGMRFMQTVNIMCAPEYLQCTVPKSRQKKWKRETAISGMPGINGMSFQTEIIYRQSEAGKI